jgi:hypothetical protein
MIWFNVIGPHRGPDPTKDLSRMLSRIASTEPNRLIGSRSRQVYCWSRRRPINKRPRPDEKGITT